MGTKLIIISILVAFLLFGLPSVGADIWQLLLPKCTDGIGCVGLIFWIFGIMGVLGFLFGLVKAPRRHKLYGLGILFLLGIGLLTLEIGSDFSFLSGPVFISYSIGWLVGEATRFGASRASRRFLRESDPPPLPELFPQISQWIVNTLLAVVVLAFGFFIVQTAIDFSSVENRIARCDRQGIESCYERIKQQYGTVFTPELCVARDDRSRKLCLRGASTIYKIPL